jgi:hypothetical protein
MCAEKTKVNGIPSWFWMIVMAEALPWLTENLLALIKGQGQNMSVLGCWLAGLLATYAWPGHIHGKEALKATLASRIQTTGRGERLQQAISREGAISWDMAGVYRFTPLDEATKTHFLHESGTSVTIQHVRITVTSLLHYHNVIQTNRVA